MGVLVDRLRQGAWGRSPDEVVVEEPLEIRLDGHLVATTMRTPGHDYELAVGFCAGDGLLAGATVTGVRYCGEGPAAEFEYNVVTVETGATAPVPAPRLGNVSAACGICGSTTIIDMAARLGPLASSYRFDSRAVSAAVAAGSAAQSIFGRTGGLHAAATFDTTGRIDVLREDIGRHNAVDKVVGRRLLDGRDDAGAMALFVSGRASFEMVQKAWAAGIGTLIAVSAPSSLAIEASRAAGITLAGFARGDELNVYCGRLADQQTQTFKTSATNPQIS